MVLQHTHAPHCPPAKGKTLGLLRLTCGGTPSCCMRCSRLLRRKGCTLQAASAAKYSFHAKGGGTSAGAGDSPW